MRRSAFGARACGSIPAGAQVLPAPVHRHKIAGEGDMDLQAYISRLHEVGYTGGLALDLYKVDYAGVAPDCIAYLQERIEKAQGSC
ncbi:MAG: hypothetical protein ACLFUS_08375 [Candidatus Sumerlaeia bacterium]